MPDEKRARAKTARASTKAVEVDEWDDDDPSCWKDWHPGIMACDGTMLMAAPRGGFKTTSILDHMARGCNKEGIVICPTPELYKTYGTFWPILFGFATFDDKFEAWFDAMLTKFFTKSLEIDFHSKQLCNAELARLEEDHTIAHDAAFAKLLERAERHHWPVAKAKTKADAFKKEWEEKFRKNTLELIAEQAKRLNEMRKAWSWMCVLDDLGYDPAAMNSPSIAKMAKNGRHYLCKTMCAIQAPLDYKSKNRDQIDFLAMSAKVQTGNIKRFNKEYMPSGLSDGKLGRILQLFKRNKWWLVIDRRTNSTNPCDYIYRYQTSPIIPPRRFLCSHSSAYLHKILYDTEKARNLILNINNGEAAQNRLADVDDAAPASKKKKTKKKKTTSTGAFDTTTSDPTCEMEIFRKSADTMSFLNPATGQCDMRIFESFGPRQEVACISEYDARVRAAAAREKRRTDLRQARQATKRRDSDTDSDQDTDTVKSVKTTSRRHITVTSSF